MIWILSHLFSTFQVRNGDRSRYFNIINIYISAFNSKGAEIQLLLIRFIFFQKKKCNFTKICDCMLKMLTFVFCGYILLSKLWYRLVIWLQSMSNFELWKPSPVNQFELWTHSTSFVHWFFTFINHLQEPLIQLDHCKGNVKRQTMNRVIRKIMVLSLSSHLNTFIWHVNWGQPDIHSGRKSVQ